MKPYQETTLPNNILDLLTEFYNSLYDKHFISIYSVAGGINSDVIVVNSNIKQYGRLRIGADIYGSVQAARYKKSSYVLARFVQVQFFFEHLVYLNLQPLTHSLALVK